MMEILDLRTGWWFTARGSVSLFHTKVICSLTDGFFVLANYAWGTAV